MNAQLCTKKLKELGLNHVYVVCVCFVCLCFICVCRFPTCLIVQFILPENLSSIKSNKINMISAMLNILSYVLSLHTYTQSHTQCSVSYEMEVNISILVLNFSPSIQCVWFIWVCFIYLFIFFFVHCNLWNTTNKNIQQKLYESILCLEYICP